MRYPEKETTLVATPVAACSFSLGTGDLLSQVKTAAKHFLDDLTLPPDRVPVVQAGKTGTLMQSLTASKASASAAIDSLVAGTGAYLGDAIFDAHLTYVKGDPKGSTHEKVFLETIRSIRPIPK
jgi:hypothetical protein